VRNWGGNLRPILILYLGGNGHSVDGWNAMQCALWIAVCDEQVYTRTAFSYTSARLAVTHQQ